MANKVGKEIAALERVAARFDEPHWPDTESVADWMSGPRPVGRADPFEVRASAGLGRVGAGSAVSVLVRAPTLALLRRLLDREWLSPFNAVGGSG